MKDILRSIKFPCTLRFVDATVFQQKYYDQPDSVTKVFEDGVDKSYKVLYLITKQPQLLENTYILDVHLRSVGNHCSAFT